MLASQILLPCKATTTGSVCIDKGEMTYVAAVQTDRDSASLFRHGGWCCRWVSWVMEISEVGALRVGAISVCLVSVRVVALGEIGS